MSVMYVRNKTTGKFEPIKSLQGNPGKDGVMTFEDLTDEQRESLRGPAGKDGKDGEIGPQGQQGPTGAVGATPNLTFLVETGAAGSDVQIEQSGTAEDPVIKLVIPRGDTGAVEGVDYYEGLPNALGTASPGTANGVARGNHVHPMPTAEQVGARSKDWLPSLTDIGAQPAGDYALKSEIPAAYTLPTATADTLGGVKSSDAVTVNADGTMAVNQLNGKYASEYALEDTLALIHDRIYPGVDLTVKFADEIANYSDEWAWITARIKAGNFSKIHVGDYIPVTTSRADGFIFKAQIAGIDTYYRYGDSAVGHHIDFISTELWPDLMVMNQVNYNNGTANTPYPWLASHCYAFLNSLSMAVPNEAKADPALADVDYTAGGILYYLPDKLKNKIVQKRVLLGQRYTAGSLLTETNSWGWTGIGKLWVPSEIEVYGQGCWANHPYDKGGFMHYPIFTNNMNRVKLRNNGRSDWWLLSPYAGNSGNFANVGHYGHCNIPTATNTWVGAPVCFRIA